MINFEPLTKANFEHVGITWLDTTTNSSHHVKSQTSIHLERLFGFRAESRSKWEPAANKFLRRFRTVNGDYVLAELSPPLENITCWIVNIWQRKTT